jgi:hypothetical protein
MLVTRRRNIGKLMTNIVQFPIDTHLSQEDLDNDADAKRSFRNALIALQDPASPLEARMTPKTSDWNTLMLIHDALEQAFLTDDWDSAKKRIETAMRRQQIRIVKLP